VGYAFLIVCRKPALNTIAQAKKTVTAGKDDPIDGLDNEGQQKERDPARNRSFCVTSVEYSADGLRLQ